MSLVFVDTAAWIALLNADDEYHQRALQVMATLAQQRARLITTEFVFLEVADALSSPSFRRTTAEFLDGLRRESAVQIVAVTSALLSSGWELYRQRHDKEWGLTDCTSFALMTQENVLQAFTSDHHFEQAGFVKLL